MVFGVEIRHTVFVLDILALVVLKPLNANGEEPPENALFCGCLTTLNVSGGTVEAFAERSALERLVRW